MVSVLEIMIWDDSRNNWLIYFGVSLTSIFGGGFLIRLVRDGDFYIAEFIVGIIGLAILLFSFARKFKKRRSSI